tara:strand:- start:6987 stop:9413 length:2427 start_codon:yes stop_codon:yes gene_type:complete
MAEGDIPSEAELAAAIEKLDTVIAKQKELLELRLQDARIVGDISEQTRIAAELRERELTLLSQRIDGMEDLRKLSDEDRSIMAETLNLTEQQLRLALNAEDARATLLTDIAEQRAQQELIKEASQETDKFVGGIASKLGMASNFGETAAGKFLLMADNLSQSGMAADIINGSLMRTFNVANIAATALSFMAESVVAVALALDTANSKFQRTTGLAGDFKGVMTDIGQAGLLSGVSIDDAGEAMGSLVGNFSAFNPTATETNARLGETAALLAKTGVAADVSAGTMDFFTRAMGMSAIASADLTRELALAGTGIGIATSKMLSDFEAVNGYLIGFGDRTTTVFKNLQAQAKATGIEIGSLVGIAQNFDAFDTAADATGRLNAVLGTNLSTIEMLNLETDQRLSRLAQEIQMSTGGFKNLDRYTQMYVAQTIGAKDAAEAERLLNIARNPAELAKYNTEMQASAMRQDQLADLTAKMVPIQEQFMIAVMGLGLALEPVVELLGLVFQGVWFLLRGFFELNDLTGGLLVPALGILATSLIAVNVAANFGAILSLLSAGMTMLGLSAKFASTRMIAFTLLFTALYGILSMVINPVFAAVFHFMAVGITLLGRAFASVPTKAIGAILAFSLLAATLGFLISAMKEMTALLITNVDILPQLAVGLLAVGYAFSVFGAGVLTGALALGMAMPMLGMAVPVLGLIALSAMAIGVGFDMMGDGLIKMGSGLSAVVAGLSVIDSLSGDDGFLAVTTDGGKTSMVSAKGGVLKSFTSENISVDVKIPEIKVPAPIVHVYIDGREVRKMVRTEMSKVGGG